MTKLSVTEGSSSFVLFIAYFTSLVLTLIWTLFNLLSSEEHALTITLFYYLSSVEQTCNKVLSMLILFDSLSYEEQTR